MAKYKYTCPDVVHYRRNQYRMVYASFAVSVVQMVVMWAGLEMLNKKYAEKVDAPLPSETQE